MSGRLGGLALSKAMRWRLGFRRGSCEFDARLLLDGRVARGRRAGRLSRFARLADVVLARGVGAEDGKTNDRDDGPGQEALPDDAGVPAFEAPEAWSARGQNRARPGFARGFVVVLSPHAFIRGARANVKVRRFGSILAHKVVAVRRATYFGCLLPDHGG